MDTVDRVTRSRMMAAVKGKNTTLEITIRKALFACGLRYRLHAKELPGRPDLVFPRHRAVVFVHGCFWHGHDCVLFRWPGTRQEFWREKINGNRARDHRQRVALCAQGWRVATLWECSVRGKSPQARIAVAGRVYRWLTERRTAQYEICGPRE